ncbi:MAG: hypothetical protein HRU19_22470 [Pseudobacteriovorax sp.]|nr:hypothetical protein [Pseudobacteriovorax sp.]
MNGYAKSVLLTISLGLGLVDLSLARSQVEVVTAEKVTNEVFSLYGQAQLKTQSSRSGEGVFVARFQVDPDLAQMIPKRLIISLPVAAGQNKVQSRQIGRQDGLVSYTFRYPMRTIEGLRVVASLRVGPDDHLFQLPLNAITSPSGENTFIFFVEDGKAHRQQIDIVAHKDDKVYFFQKDMPDAAKVVVKGLGNLLNQETVEVQP